jgi:hypothetical protein
MTESSNSHSISKKHIYLLIEEENESTHISSHMNIQKLCVKATTWVDSYYKHNKMEYPKKLPGLDDIILVLKPIGFRNSFTFHENKNMKYKVYIKRTVLHN